MAVKYNHMIWLMILFVCFTLPLETHEFSYAFGKSPDVDVDGDGSDQAEKKVSVSSKRATERKFKFHKIERVYVDDNSLDEEEDQNDDDTNNAKSEELSNEQNTIDRNILKKRKKSNDHIEDFGPVEKTASDVDDNPSDSNFKSWLQLLKETFTRENKEDDSSNEANTQWFPFLKHWSISSFVPVKQFIESINKLPDEQQYSERENIANAYTDSCSTCSQQERSRQSHFEFPVHSLPTFLSGSEIKNEECRQQLQELHHNFLKHKLWALKIFDATGKINSGLLRGNINQLGDFDLCTQVRTVVHPTEKSSMRIHGKYCLAQIEIHAWPANLKAAINLVQGRGLWHGYLANPRHLVPRYTVANWGICVPNSCSASEVHDMLKTYLELYNDTGVTFHVEVDDDDCTVKQKTKFFKLLKKDKAFAFSIVAISLLLSICVLALIWQHWNWINAKVQGIQIYDSIKQKFPIKLTWNIGTSTLQESPEESNSKPHENETSVGESEVSNQTFSLPFIMPLLEAFSPQRTWLSLISLEPTGNGFPIIHIIRVGATFMLYVSLKFIMAGHLPLKNRDSLVHAVEQPWSMLFRAPLFYSDVLLLVSGFLAAYQLTHEMEASSHIHWLKSLATKMGRYLPTIFVALSFQAWILPHLGDGPLWNLLIGDSSRFCAQHMWRNALSAQNTIDFEETCSPIAQEVSLNIQLYLLALLLVWLYYKKPEVAFFVYGGFHILSVAIRFSRTQQLHLAATLFHGLNISKFYRTANLIYLSPISRATSYLLGIGAALFHRREENRFVVACRYKSIGWGLSVVGIAWCILSQAASMHSGFVYTSSDSAKYMAWTPLISGMAIFWCIIMWPSSEGVVLRYPRIVRFVVLLSRITFPLQLTTYMVVLRNTARVKDIMDFHISHLINIKELALIVCLAIGVAFLIDVPAQHIRRMLIEMMFIKSTICTTDFSKGAQEKTGDHDAAAAEQSEPLQGNEEGQDMPEGKEKKAAVLNDEDEEEEEASESENSEAE